MARPAKPTKIIQMEKKAHRTPQELAIRERGEKALQGGDKIRERADVKADPVAHKEFKRYKRLFLLIDKNDDLYGDIANTLAMLMSEIAALEKQRNLVREQLDALSPGDFGDAEQYWKTYTTLLEQTNRLEARIDNKRKIHFSIEKENCMTIAGALRAIPKTAPKENPLKEALYGT